MFISSQNVAIFQTALDNIFYNSFYGKYKKITYTINPTYEPNNFWWNFLTLMFILDISTLIILGVKTIIK